MISITNNRPYYYHRVNMSMVIGYYSTSYYLNSYLSVMIKILLSESSERVLSNIVVDNRSVNESSNE